MGEIHVTGQNELTRVLAERHREMWDAYMRVDEAARSTFMTEDFRAVHPNGTVHIGKPSAKEIAAEPIEDYWLTEMQAWPVGKEAAIVTYTAEVQARVDESSARFKFEVGEVWLKVGGQWRCRYYHATMQR
jgi:hypothetical protein